MRRLFNALRHPFANLQAAIAFHGFTPKQDRIGARQVAQLITSGDDLLARALTVNTATARDLGEIDGIRWFVTIGGQPVSGAYIDRARELWGDNPTAYDIAMRYETDKAITAKQLDKALRPLNRQFEALLAAQNVPERDIYEP